MRFRDSGGRLIEIRNGKRYVLKRRAERKEGVTQDAAVTCRYCGAKRIDKPCDAYLCVKCRNQTRDRKSVV